MLAQFSTFKRKQNIARGVALVTVSALALIEYLPKPQDYASPKRLVMTAAFFTVVSAGYVFWSIARKQAQKAKRDLQYYGAPAAIKNTVRFASDEQEALTRGFFLCWLSIISLGGLHTLSAWPQAHALAPYRETFGYSAPAIMSLMALSIYWRRKNAINGIYLKHYLRQQAAHINFRLNSIWKAKKLAKQLSLPAVTHATATTFCAAGVSWTLDDLWKNCVVFGQPGSGKTETILSTMLEAMFATSNQSTLPTSGLILDVKGDFKRKLIALAKRYGREDDLVILSASDWREFARTFKAIAFNPLDTADDGLEVAARLITAAIIAGGVKTNDTFFLDAARTALRHGIEFLRAANPDNPPSLNDLRHLAADAGGEDEEESPYYFELSSAILQHYPNPESMPSRVIEAINHYETEWRRMPDRQKAGVLGTITQIADEYSVEPFNEMMSGPSTISISDVIDQGKLLLVDLPMADRPRISIMVNCLIKLEFQKQILRRVNKERPSFFLCDEYPVLFTSGQGQGDAEFFALSRASRHSNIVAAQNISGFYKKSDNKDEIKNFLGNCATKVFLRNEPETNEFSSKLFGERSEIVVSANESAQLNEGSRRSFTSYSRSTKTTRVCFRRKSSPILLCPCVAIPCSNFRKASCISADGLRLKSRSSIGG